MQLSIQTVVILVVGMLLTANAAPASFRIMDSPETNLFQSLTPSEQKAVLDMALTDDSLVPEHPLKGHTSSNHSNSSAVQKLALELKEWIKTYRHLTPDQVNEIQETGKLCNDDGDCIDFGNWGGNCCPFG